MSSSEQQPSAPSPKTHKEWFLFYLFNDPDFVTRKKELSDTIKRRVGTEAYGVMMLLSPGASLRQQLKDNYGDAFDNEIQEIENLGREFDVSADTIELGLRYTFVTHELTFKTTPFAYIEDGNVLVRLNANSRLEDLKRMFWYIQELQKQLPDYHARNRTKERPDLIYAIYKQRLKGLTWRQIYSQYENGMLEGYDGAASITSEENLATVYRKYKPNV